MTKCKGIMGLLFGHQYYSPTMDFELIAGNKKKFEKENPIICLRCGYCPRLKKIFQEKLNEEG